MAFDGITVSSIVKELNDNIINGKIAKIAQPEKDELLITIKGGPNGQKRLLMSASASLPLIYFTDNNKPSPITAPNFCMLLRKHISNGRIISISQPSLERVINITIEHLDELGDLKQKTLVMELMGKHSNIIFLNDNNTIIDSIKHVPSSVSSVREVLPGKDYFIPGIDSKRNPLNETFEDFRNTLKEHSCTISKSLYSSYTGLSPFFSEELCFEASVDSSLHPDMLSDIQWNLLYTYFQIAMNRIKEGDFNPTIVYEREAPFEYSALELKSFDSNHSIHYDNISELLENYYKEKALFTRMRQKSFDLRKIVDTILERDIKKYDLQIKQIQDTEKKDAYKLYGELLNTYGYTAVPGAKSIRVLNYYTNEEITIPLNCDYTAIENAQKYFEKYNKLKRTKEALEKLTLEVKEEIDHLQSLSNCLDIAVCEDDLNAIKDEMIASGYIKHSKSEKKQKTKSSPFHFITKEGFHIYVGKNNLQNEYITFDLANGNDWWFHAKKIPGSHVIVKTEGKTLPDSVFEDAARLAAHYSKAKNDSRIEVDYVKRKEVKHPNGSKPGFVVYYTNYSMLTDSDISHLSPVTGE